MPFRASVADFLPTLDSETPSLAISRADVTGYTYWNLYLAPFSVKLWKLLLGTHYTQSTIQ